MLDSATASHSLSEMLGLGSVTARAVYATLDRLGAEQSFIENQLARRHLKNGTLVLYDVTSTTSKAAAVCWPTTATAAAIGGNRPQLVIGLLCAADGCPVPVEVF